MRSKNKKLTNQIITVLTNVCGKGKFPLHEPTFAGEEKEYLSDCIDSNYVSSVGKYVNLFEKSISNYTKSKNVVCVVNGTSALHLSLKALNIKFGDEVLIPGLTFVATANAVSYCGATPHCVDIDKKNLGIDADSLFKWLKEIAELKNKKCYNKKTGNIIKAIIPVHVFGYPCNIDKIIEIANKFNLEVVEDAAESLGSWYKGKHTGTFGKFGILSFNGNKIITTGGGGAILTNDKKMANKVRHLSQQAKLNHPWNFIHDQIGYNYRLPNINAAIGYAQIKNLDNFIKSKQQLYNKYQNCFKKINGVKLLKQPRNTSCNYWLLNILLDSEFEPIKNKIIMHANKKGFFLRPAWKLLNSLDPYKKCPTAPLKIAKLIEKRLISLPSSAKIVEINYNSKS